MSNESMKDETRKLLMMALQNDELVDQWLNGYNHAFKMTPQEMIDIKREDEVISYLDFIVYGPY